MIKEFFLCTLSFVTLSFIMVSCGDFNAPTNPNSDQGALKGVFTVSSTGKKVRFSQGNLQYNPKADKWRFAENQWDFIGKDNENIVVENYDGWLDLFGWGTGDNPTKHTKEWSDYSSSQDWGENPILNGGNKKNAWSTLTSGRWHYLIFERDQKLFGFGTVNNIPGLILLPDEWILPEGLTFNPSTEKGLEWGEDYLEGQYINSNKDNFLHNSYNKEEWTKMEAAGAVFLPAASVRSGAEYYNKEELEAYCGTYWSKTNSSSYFSNAYSLEFTNWILQPATGKSLRLLYFGCSVRLVQDVK